MPLESKQTIGGGWSFAANLKKGLAKRGYEVYPDNNADVVLREIPAPKQTFLLMPQPDGTLAGYINMDFSDTLPSCDGSVERTAEGVSARPA